MSVQAMGCFERETNGDWVCKKNAEIEGRSCRVAVSAGATFRRGTIYAGYSDFPGFLDSVAIEAPSIAPGS